MKRIHINHHNQKGLADGDPVSAGGRHPRRASRAALISALAVLTALCAVFCACGIFAPDEGGEQTAPPSSTAVPGTEPSGNEPSGTEANGATDAPAPTAVNALRITEIVNGPEGWAELENASEGTVRLSDYYLTDKQSDPEKWRFPEAEIAPGELIVVELNELHPEAPFSASFKVSRTENALYVYNFRGEPVDSIEFSIPMPDGISAVAAEGGAAYTSHVTKGEANSSETFPELEWTAMEIGAPDAALYINEVLSDNKYGITDMNGDRSDWVELKNESDAPISLDGYYLSDDEADPLKWRMPAIEAAPGSYVLIFLSGNESGEQDPEIHAPFSLHGGECLLLSRLDGMKQDRIDIPEDLKPNVSIGRNAANEIRYYAAPTPNAPNSTYGLEHYADAGSFDPHSVYISEVCAVAPARSGENDWVELYNGSDERMDMSGWRLTDDPLEPDKFDLEGYKISAGGYAVITCTSSAKPGSSKAPFSVSNTGDTLYLIDPWGAVRDTFETGVTSVGMTSGREHMSQTGARCFFTRATKGSKNGEPVSGMAAEPVFSRTQLLSSEGFQLSITCSTPGAQIRYTLDGSEPNSESKLYSSPLSITDNTIVRARAFAEGLAKSPVATHTYVVGKDYSLPVVCLSMSRSDYSRMYVAQSQPNGGVVKGDEVPCFMEYYIDGRLAISSGAGVRVSGASTAVYPQKSLGLYFRAGYGRSTLDFPLFKGCDVTSFRSLTLRNGGQDAYYARMRDSYMSRVLRGMDLDVAYVQPVIVFINGEYRGVYDLKENMNEDYVAAHHGIDRDTVEIARRNGKMIAGTKEQWSKMLNMCRTLDMSKQENFDKLAKLVDTDSIMDYLIARTYFYDGDMYNQKYWHTNDDKVRWRSVLYDSDYAMFGSSPGGNILSMYFNPEGVKSFHGFVTTMDVFCALNKNREWRDKFITRYIWCVKHLFNKERALPLFDELLAEYQPEMRSQIAKWHMPSTYDKWQEEVAAFRSCVERRPDYALKNLKNFYHLSDSSFAEYVRRAEEP